jgi:hypothetical protein
MLIIAANARRKKNDDLEETCMKKWIDKRFSVCKSTTYISKLKGFDWTPKMFSIQA